MEIHVHHVQHCILNVNTVMLERRVKHAKKIIIQVERVVCYVQIRNVTNVIQQLVIVQYVQPDIILME